MKGASPNVFHVQQLPFPSLPFLGYHNYCILHSGWGIRPSIGVYHKQSTCLYNLILKIFIDVVWAAVGGSSVRVDSFISYCCAYSSQNLGYGMPVPWVWAGSTTNILHPAMVHHHDKFSSSCNAWRIDIAGKKKMGAPGALPLGVGVGLTPIYLPQGL